MSDTKTIAGGPVIPSTTLVQADQVTILGDGSRERPLHSSSGGGVVVDGITILGNGTIADPIHAGPVDGTYQAAFRNGTPLPGMPVFISFVDQSSTGDVTTVQSTFVDASDDGNGLAGALATTSGIVSRVNLDGSVQIFGGGLLTLTTLQWDAVTGDSGGLTLGNTYYPSAITPGEITNVRPSGVGQFVTKIGVAVSDTTMLVQPARPMQNLADMIVFVRFATSSLIVGSAVIVSAANTIQSATSNSSTSAAQAIGIIAGFDTNNDPIVQISGVVTLTTAQWDAVTDTTPGMNAGTAYYVDTDANPGHLTGTAPTVNSKVQIGVGLSTTRLVLSAPCLQKLS